MVHVVHPFFSFSFYFVVGYFPFFLCSCRFIVVSSVCCSGATSFTVAHLLGCGSLEFCFHLCAFVLQFMIICW